VCCSVLQCVAVCYSVLQCVAVCCTSCIHNRCCIHTYVHTYMHRQYNNLRSCVHSRCCIHTYVHTHIHVSPYILVSFCITNTYHILYIDNTTIWSHLCIIGAVYTQNRCCICVCVWDRLNYMSFLQDIVSLIGLFCKRD